MGEVYAAADKELGGVIALKALHPQLGDSNKFDDRFRREIQIALLQASPAETRKGLIV
jgi:serine/threonine protein kinase